MLFCRESQEAFEAGREIKFAGRFILQSGRVLYIMEPEKQLEKGAVRYGPCV